jgi:hypothetical protein
MDMILAEDVCEIKWNKVCRLPHAVGLRKATSRQAIYTCDMEAFLDYPIGSVLCLVLANLWSTGQLGKSEVLLSQVLNSNFISLITTSRSLPRRGRMVRPGLADHLGYTVSMIDLLVAASMLVFLT